MCTSDFVRFMRLVKIGQEPGACWEWQGNKPDGRYGHFSVGGKAIKAHRWLYEAVVECIPERLVLRHKCDNPKCVNPDHLTPGTHAENAQDAIIRGRMPSRQGSLHPMTSLDETKVAEIRVQASLGCTQRQIAVAYGISRQQVGKIVRRENWSHM